MLPARKSEASTGVEETGEGGLRSAAMEAYSFENFSSRGLSADAAVALVDAFFTFPSECHDNCWQLAVGASYGGGFSATITAPDGIVVTHPLPWISDSVNRLSWRLRSELMRFENRQRDRRRIAQSQAG
jgi:hypothetical protein